MAQMPAAGGAHDLYAAHSPAVVGLFQNRGSRCGLKEAGPAGSRFKLVFRIEQALAAACAAVRALFLEVPKFASKGALGALFSEHETRHVWQFLFPFGLGLLNCQWVLAVFTFGFRLRRLSCAVGQHEQEEGEEVQAVHSTFIWKPRADRGEMRP